jgi:hypothetical protein
VIAIAASHSLKVAAAATTAESAASAGTAASDHATAPAAPVVLVLAVAPAPRAERLVPLFVLLGHGLGQGDIQHVVVCVRTRTLLVDIFR